MPRKNKSQAMLVRARQHQVLELYSKGKSVDQIALTLQMRVKEVNDDIVQAVDRMLAHFTCPPQHTFVRYAVFNLAIVRKLQALVDRFNKDESTVQYNAAISALRAQSDIYDKVLEKGLDFGVIERKKASKAVQGSKGDLKQLLKQEILTLSSLLDEVDLSVQFTAARRTLRLQERVTAARAQREYVPIIIKPLTGPNGVIRLVPDWKYPRRPYTRASKQDTALEQLTQAEQEHFLLAQELRRSTTVDQSTSPVPLTRGQRIRRNLPALPQAAPSEASQQAKQAPPSAPSTFTKASWLQAPSPPPSTQASKPDQPSKTDQT